MTFDIQRPSAKLEGWLPPTIVNPVNPNVTQCIGTACLVCISNLMLRAPTAKVRLKSPCAHMET